MGKVNHITMLVSGEQEYVIRSLFKDKNWQCWLKVLTNENVAGLIEGGFTYIFPSMEKDYGVGSNMCTGIKTEVMDVVGSDDDHIINAAKDSIIKCTVDSEDLIDYDMVQKKSGLDLNNNKTETTKADASEQTGGSISGQASADKTNENTLDKRLKCNLCETYCKTRKLLRSHFYKHHNGMWLEFECMDCCETFKTKEELWEHRRNANHALSPVLTSRRKELYTPEELLAVFIKCEVCSQLYPNRLSLRRHMYEVHRDVLPKCTCAVCGAVFKTRHAFWRQHSTCHTMIGTYQCDSCVKFISRYDSFEQHKLTCNTDGYIPDALKNLSCNICGIVLMSMKRVKLHKLRFHVGAPIVCHECGVTCANRRALLKHQRYQHDLQNRYYGCDNCGKTFFSNTSLMHHKRTHTKERPVQMSNV